MNEENNIIPTDEKKFQFGAFKISLLVLIFIKWCYIIKIDLLGKDMLQK